MPDQYRRDSEREPRGGRMTFRNPVMLVGLAAAGVFLPASVSAQDAKNQGYLVDSQGNVVRAAGAGVCVRTNDWTPARATEECDPDLVKKPAPKVAPPAKKEEAKPAAAAAPKKEGGKK